MSGAFCNGFFFQRFETGYEEIAWCDTGKRSGRSATCLVHFVMDFFSNVLRQVTRKLHGVTPGSAAGEVQRAEFAVPCDMRKSHVALAGLNH